MTLPFSPINICAERGCGRQRIPYQAKCAEHAAADRKHWSWWASEAVPPPAVAQHAVEAWDWDFPESYSINAATRDAALEKARNEFGPEAHIALTEATQDGPFDTDLFDGDSPMIDALVAAFAEANADRFGEDGFEGDIDQDKLAAHLNRALADFFARHGGTIAVFTFTEQRNREIVPPEMVA